MRDIFIVGNWKMNQTKKNIKAFVDELAVLGGKQCFCKRFFKKIFKKRSSCSCCCSDSKNRSVHAWIAPQFIHISFLKKLKSKLKLKLKIGAQNCAYKESGAYTGEVSPVALKDMGVNFTIIGHSERRALFHESHSDLNAKTILALKVGLKVIFCVGETLEEREQGKMQAVIEEQIIKGLENLPADKIDNLLIAYEPVWAIGTGKTASKEQAQEVHAFIRGILPRLGLSSDATPILYGGSVKPSNIEELLSQKDIDGALVGGASLKAKDFYALYLGKSA